MYFVPFHKELLQEQKFVSGEKAKEWNDWKTISDAESGQLFLESNASISMFALFWIWRVYWSQKWSLEFADSNSWISSSSVDFSNIPSVLWQSFWSKHEELERNFYLPVYCCLLLIPCFTNHQCNRLHIHPYQLNRDKNSFSLLYIQLHSEHPPVPLVFLWSYWYLRESKKKICNSLIRSLKSKWSIWLKR